MTPKNQPASPDQEGAFGRDIDKAVRIIQRGGVVAIPTETYYGLAADPFCDTAVKRIFQIKRRSPAKPILTLVNSETMLECLALEVPLVYRAVMQTFWPGPLTLIFPARSNLSSFLTGSTGTVGIRISSNRYAGEILDRLGKPLTATSANLSGFPPCCSAAEVLSQLGDTIDYVFDGGETPGGAGSTIVKAQDKVLCLIRAGEVPFADILAVNTS